MTKIKYTLEALVVITIALAFILPGAAVVTNKETSYMKDNLWEGKKRIDIREALTWSPSSKALPVNLYSNIAISGWTEGEARRPSITRDSLGNVFVTYQLDQDIFASSPGFAYNPNPMDQQAWWDNGVVLTLSDASLIYYPDTALCAHPDYELMNVFVAYDAEQAGGMYIPDVTDYTTWEIYTWTTTAPDQELAQISDGGWYQDLNYPDVIGPFNFYIYHEIYETYDLESCPIFFHTGIDAASGVGYFDGQSDEITAPAGDPDYVNLENKIHTVIYNTETQKIIWKKIVPAEECDYEFTPYQATVADGTNPTIAAYDNQVAIVYHNAGQIKCVYSSDDGESWSQPVTIGPGAYPDCYAQGSTVIAAYVNSGNLYTVNSKDGGATWSTPEKKNDQDGSVVAQENCIDVHSAGIVWVDNRNEAYNIYYTSSASSPNKPVITGPSSGKPNKEYDFTVTTTDPEDGQVWYWIDWGDTTNTGWLGPFASGKEITESHTWTTKANFTVKAKAKNLDDIESNWAELPFSTPTNKALFFDFLIKFFNAFPLLRHIIGY